jgi:hypothetical protein
MKYKWIATVLGLVLFSCAHAGQKQGRISSVLLVQTHADRVFIKVNAPYSQAEPACSSGVSEWDFVLDISTSTGKATYALLLTAQATQTSVIVDGTNTCSLHSSYETVSYVSNQS